MEQQRDDWETLSYLDKETRVKFQKGCYSCKEVKGSYSTLEQLKEAWIQVLRKEKRIELARIRRKLKTANKRCQRWYGSARNYLLRECEKWQIKKIGR